MTISSLVLTDGTNVATLTDGTNYALASGGWAPQIARRRTAELGGVGPDEDIEEQIQIDILSTPRSLTTTLANVAKLVALCDQARRWRMGAPVAAVRLQITMLGGVVKESVIVDAALELAADYADQLVIQEVGMATLRLTRRALWLGVDVAATVLTARVAGAEWATATAWTGANSVETPLRLLIRAAGTAHVKIDSALLIVANGPTGVNISVNEAEFMPLPGSSRWSVVADAANIASGGSVLRYNHASPNPNIATNKTTTTVPKFPTVYAVVRALTANTVFQFTINLYNTIGRVASLVTTLGPYPAGVCQIVNLGTYLGPIAVFSYDVACNQTSGVASTLDVDVVAHVSQEASVVRFSMPNAVAGVASGGYAFYAAHSLRSALKPVLNGTDLDALSYTGDIYFSTAGTSVIACMFAPSGTKWQPEQVAAPTLAQTYTIEYTGTKAYLAPE